MGVDIVAAIEQGRYVSLDIADTLSTFMVSGLPDPARFLKDAGNLVAAAAKASKGERPRVATCGECAPALWVQGRADAAVQVEHLWDEMAQTHRVDILCGYVLNSVQREQESHIASRMQRQLTWTKVPFSGRESTENVPFTGLTRCESRFHFMISLQRRSGVLS
jgi:hypothetical protein